MIIRNGTVLHVNRLERGRGRADRRPDHRRDRARGSAAQDEQTLDAAGCYVLPGFIDLHTHGLRHVYVQEGGWREYAALQLEQGVTGCLPTLFGPPAVVAEAMRRGRAETADLQDTPNLLGFRLEMPYLAKPGAGQDIRSGRHRRRRDRSHVGGRAAARCGCGMCRPSCPARSPFIRWAAARGIITSMAHTHATWQEAQRGGRCGSIAGHPLLRHIRRAPADRRRGVPGRPDRLHPDRGPARGGDHPRRRARAPVPGGEDAALQGLWRAWRL